MNLTLKRIDYREDGIFGVLHDENYKQVAVTLEAAYDSQHGNGSYLPKLPPGEYVCRRVKYRLNNLKSLETFEIMDIPGHKEILFNTGSYNNDAKDCILLGHGFGGDPRMISNSLMAFSAFMALQYGVDSFILVVKE